MRKLPLVAVLICAGCLGRQLRVPAQDHHVQTRTISNRCDAGAYGPCSPELKEDLEAMAAQACLIEAIAVGDDGAACKAEASK